ncbi:agmatinase [Zhaonella formicivorans]|uniref:agmatinase n=1 Tax=Zhaonella formicivorans TaxID=2528593 RepID=UPI0010EAE263|nr:agmatinase [Zhaonella formicivorans]
MPLTERTGVFMGSSDDYDTSRFVLIGAPMDFTVSFRPGSRNGPQFIRMVSSGLEEYSVYQDKELADYNYYDYGDLILPFGNVKESLNRIELAAGEIVEHGKFPIFLGGEHLISLAVIKAMVKKYPDLAVLHFDAHADLRCDYIGEVESHATVMRYASELLGKKQLYQFGIRSGTREEFEYAREHTNMFIDELLGPLEQVVENWKGSPVYISIDIDVVDPAFAPGTGTPEPGGCTAKEIIKAINIMSKLPVVGMDIVEVLPMVDQSQRTALLAAKLVREAILAF